MTLNRSDPRLPNWRLVALLLLAAGAVLYAVRGRIDAVTGDPKPPGCDCPADSEPNAPRTRGLLALLKGVVQAHQVTDLLPQFPCVCYGDNVNGVMVHRGPYLLDKRQGDPANAARLAHLMLHRLEGSVLDESTGSAGSLPCPEWVDRVMSGERRAHELEAELRQIWGLERASDDSDALEAAYRTRCQHLRSERQDDVIQ